MRGERLFTLATIAGVALAAKEISNFAFSQKQKEIIKQRDNHECQFPEHLNGHAHECTQGKGLVVHHIKPQAYLKEFDVDPDFIENGITICGSAHDKIHPDIAYARKAWRPKGDSFLKVQAKVMEHLQNREPFWVTTWDRAMETIALRNTQKMEEQVNADLNTGEVLVYKAK